MSEVVVISPEKLQSIIADAVASGVGSALAALNHNAPREMNDQEAAKYLGLAPITLRNWRTQKKGPKYHKTGRTVRYAKKDLDEYLRQSEVHTIDSLEAGRGTFC